MTRDTLIGTLLESIFVYSIPDGRLLHQGRTGKNPNGIADFRSNKLAVPGHKTGSVHVCVLFEYCVYGKEFQRVTKSHFQIYDIFPMREKNISSPPIQIYAHQGTIAAICLSNNGSKLATASDKGILKVYGSCKLWVGNPY